MKLIGPFTQLVTLRNLPKKGALTDDTLEIISNAGILAEDGVIQSIGKFNVLRQECAGKQFEQMYVGNFAVGLPGFVDPHTHICFAGDRARDYTKRIAGKSYLQIASEGGGIWQTVTQTRAVAQDVLTKNTIDRANMHLHRGVTTIEIKSGYGLQTEQELKMLRAISQANMATKADLVPTCLAAHIVPNDFEGDAHEYLQLVISDLLPAISREQLAARVDIFVEQGAFHGNEALFFLKNAAELGFDLTVHGDQFTPSGSEMAINVGAVSVDHLEAAGPREIEALAASDVTATVLPGASLGLGMPFAPARKLLDGGAAVAIGSDWNPGSAPMGDLLTQAALLGASQKLTMAETLAGITTRAADALKLTDRGVLAPGMLADIVVFPCGDIREILYYQGQLKPGTVLKKGLKIHENV